MADHVQPVNKTQLPPVIAPTAAAAGDYVWCDVRWYLDGRSGYDAYRAGHIDGAIFVDLDAHLAAPPTQTAGRHPLPEPQRFAQSLGELGISADDQVVAYDDAGGMSAGRLVWMLRALGTSAALLDGGLPAWVEDGCGELSTEPVSRPHTTVPMREWPAELLADADLTAAQAQASSAQAGLDQPNPGQASPTAPVVVDARSAERYRGEVEPVDARPGHIPGALNLPWNGNLDSHGRFLSPADLRERFEGVGIFAANPAAADPAQAKSAQAKSAPTSPTQANPAAAPVMYCGSGVSACHNLLALEHAGLGTTAKLYPGSWSQWSAQPERPAELG